MLYDLHILASDQIKEESNKKSVCFFDQLLSNFRYKKQLLTFFEQLFEKIRETFWKMERFSYDLDMKTREQNRSNKRTEMERFDWFIERMQTRVDGGEYRTKMLLDLTIRNIISN